MSAQSDLRECRSNLTKVRAERDALKQELATCQVDSTAKDTVIADLQKDLGACELQVDLLQQKVKELEDQLNPPEPPPDTSNVLRDTDGQTIPQALAELQAGDTLTLVGEFGVGQEIHFPFDDMTLRADPGKAKLIATGAIGDVIGAKVGSGKGAKNITLANLDIDGNQKVTNCVAGWFGTVIRGCHIHGGKMTGFHAFTEGSATDAQILVEDTLFDHNGSPEEVGHGAAGSKVYNIHGVTYRRVISKDNTGNGLWADFQCGRIEYIDCVVENNSQKGWFFEKCGRHGNPYPSTFEYGMYVDDFTRLGGKVVYEGVWNIQGGRCQNNGGGAGDLGGLFVASSHMRMAGVEFGGNHDNLGMMVRNDPNRMYPVARTKTPPTKPGWMVEDVVIDQSSCVLNGDKIVIASNVPDGKAVVR